MPKTKRRWLRWLLLIVAILVILVASLVPAAKYWIVPRIVRSQAAAALAEYWRGSLEIGEIDFNYFAPTSIRGVRLTDESGRRWLEIDQVKLTLRDWPGLRPVLAEVSVEKLSVRAYFKNGRCLLPLSLPPSTADSEPSEYVDLKNVSIRDVSLTAVNETPKYPSAYGSFAWGPAGGGAATSPAASDQTSAFWPLALKEVRIDTVRYDKDRVETSAISSSVGLKGRVRAFLAAKLRADGSVDFSGRAAVADVPLAALTSARDSKGRPPRGMIAAAYTFAGHRADFWGFAGRGTVFLSDADAWSLPVVSALLRYMHHSADVVNFADMEASFTNRGPVLTLSRYHVASKLSAFEAEPGGTVNLSTGELDLHVITALLKDVRRALQKVPVVRLFVKAGDTFTRVRVTGRWDVPGGVKVRKSPADVLRGTGAFFVGAAETGGDLGKTVGKTFEDLWKAVK